VAMSDILASKSRTPSSQGTQMSHYHRNQNYVDVDTIT